MNQSQIMPFLNRELGKETLRCIACGNEPELIPYKRRMVCKHWHFTLMSIAEDAALVRAGVLSREHYSEINLSVDDEKITLRVSYRPLTLSIHR